MHTLFCRCCSPVTTAKIFWCLLRWSLGVSTSPQVGSIYNMGVWDKAAAACLRVDVRRTLDNEAAAPHKYQVTGWSLDNGGCIAEPHILVGRCTVFLCILHGCMAIGRLQVAFVGARLESLPKENAEAVKRLSYPAHAAVKLGATAAPDGEEPRARFLAWEGMGPLLAYAPWGPEWQAVVAMRELLRDLHSGTHPLNDLGASAVARQYRAHCCKTACQPNYLLYLEEDVTTAVADAACLGVGLGAVCADVVESLSAILKRAYNDHTARGGGGMPGATSLEREAEVVLQVWDWWLLKFDLPLRTLRARDVAPCTMATLMSNRSPPPVSLSLAPPALVSPIHGPGRDGGVDGEDVRKDEQQSGMCLCACVCLLAYEANL